MEDTIIVVQDKIDIKDLQKKAEELYGLMVKSVVDVNQKILAVGGELHSDALFQIVDNSDTTKKLTFQLSGITTGTTRTITPPNESLGSHRPSD